MGIKEGQYWLVSMFATIHDNHYRPIHAKRYPRSFGPMLCEAACWTGLVLAHITVLEVSNRNSVYAITGNALG